MSAYKMVNESKTEVAGRSNTTSVSRAWRRTAGRLCDMARPSNAKRSDAARWRVLYYKHPAPDPARALPAQLAGMKRFDDWRAMLKESIACSTTWATIYRGVAVG